MNIDLSAVPFSSSGAYTAFSLLPAAVTLPAGLFMRSMHGGADVQSPGGRAALVEVLHEGQPVPYRTAANPSRLDLISERGTLSICIAEPYLVRVRGEGVGLRLRFDAARGDYAVPAGDGRYRVNSLALRLQWMLVPLSGCWQVEDPPQPGSGSASLLCADLLPDPSTGVCEGVIEEYTSTWRPGVYEASFAECAAGVQADFDHWLAAAPELPPSAERFAAARALAAYVTWANLVELEGHLLRPAMWLSKNSMTCVPAWEHCFNAMALVYHQPIAAWDQFMTLFDQQDEHGALPGCVSDRDMVWNFVKPPIHGWALGWMMRRTPHIRIEQVRQIYGPLCRWTEWWFRFRDDDNDGIPQYHHGSDSGWENATPFTAGFPLESPDLCAFLILQMETLALLARKLKQPEECESWQRRAGELLDQMLAHFWQADHFVALRSGDHLVADTESLLLYLPLILGRRLPPAVRSELAAGLTRPGRFLTPHGLATESQSSPYYSADGGWRGPIWAASTMLMVEGLAATGEGKLAGELALRFCELAAHSGMAQNFDALSGAPLGDPASTVTASVFLVLAREYVE